ncbi:MAG: GtrA family protein [Candidatus Peregrinibacteria bacterium]
MKHYFFGRTRRLHIQFFRYLFVGGSASIVDLAVFALLVQRMNMHYASAAVIAYMAGLLWNQFFCLLWIFESSRGILRDFLLAFVIALFGLLWTELLLWMFIDHFALHAVIAKFVTLWIVLLWNFFMRKYFVFRTTRPTFASPPRE